MGTKPDSEGSGSIIVVSNRLPFVLKRTNGVLERTASAGGLVTAVAPVVVRCKGVWIGWPGIHIKDENEPIPESDPNDQTPTAGLRSDKFSGIQLQSEPRGECMIFGYLLTRFGLAIPQLSGQSLPTVQFEHPEAIG